MATTDAAINEAGQRVTASVDLLPLRDGDIVTVTVDGVVAGRGIWRTRHGAHWQHSGINDCGARLGADPDETERLYQYLDAQLRQLTRAEKVSR